MKIRNLNYLLITLIALLIPVTATSQDNAGAVKLTYNYPADAPVKYVSKGNIVQNMDINGQAMVSKISSILGCTIRSTETSGDNLTLEVKIDTMAQTIDNPNGFIGGAIRDVLGKVFLMKISTSGKETDLSGAEQISYRSEDGNINTVASSFSEFFPDMPGYATSPGYTWSSLDTIIQKNSVTTMRQIVKSENKFEGYEQVNGTNCAKIVFILSGSMDLKTQTQGMDIKMNGPYSGTGEWYFAPEKGYFIKQSINTRMSGNLEVSTPEVMSIPMVMDSKSVTEISNR